MKEWKSQVISIFVIFFLLQISGCIREKKKTPHYHTLIKCDQYIYPIAFSPVETKILYMKQKDTLTYSMNANELWIISEDGTNNEFISDCKWYPYNVSFSPDGNSIVFADGNEEYHSPHDIWMVNMETKEKKMLSNGSSYCRNPFFTPDGRKIVYINNGLWTMNLDGNKKKKITEEGSCPMITPDGDNIIYQHNEQIWITDIEGDERKQLAESGKCPTINPDGNNILFILTKSMVNCSNEDYKSILKIVDLNGNIEKESKIGIDNISIIKFSPKGDFIILNTKEYASYSIVKSWLFGINDDKIIQLDNDNANYSNYIIGHDQRYIVYRMQKTALANPPIDICVMDFDGSSSRKLTAGGINKHPLLNDEGTKIIYLHDSMGRVNTDDIQYEIRMIENSNGKWGL